ncbi:MAG: lipoprotein signal peptidase [Gammaproteobacteria bacterium]|nr:lipoprotein signal peptidase [Gammaproteobacteria bacterium]
MNIVSGGLRWLWLSVVVIVLDQWTKGLAVEGLRLFHPVPVAPFFNLTLMHNEGAAFSFLDDASGWQRWMFAAIAVVISVGIVIWLRRMPETERLRPAALALILGGALGNLYDRLTLGYVIDFIDWYYQGWHWPAFNIADSAITVGAVIYIATGLVGQGDDAYRGDN